MITVLHAGFVSNAFVLWAERSLQGESPVVGDVEPGASLHPFAGSVRSIVEALEELGTPLSGRRGEAAKATAKVWLPSQAGFPLPSTPLLGNPPSSRRQPVLEAWRVPAITVAPSELLDVLVAGDDRGEPVHGVVRGADYIFWYRAFRFVAELAAEGLYLPGLLLDGDRGRSVWEWIELAEQKEPVALLANSMPPSARAVTANDATSPPTQSPESLLRAFVSESLDRLVRDAVQVSPGLRPASLDRHPPKVLSLHERWLRALTSGERMVDATALEALALDEQVRAWREPLNTTRASPFRLCLRLEEPPVDPNAEAESADALVAIADQRPWRVSYWLQSAHDPSLLVCAEDIWTGSEGAETLAREGGDPRAYLLGALGRAAGVNGRVESSLHGDAPSGFELDAAGAHEFLIRDALLLERAGISVQLPAWWGRRGGRFRLAARARVTRHTDAGAPSPSASIRLGDLVNVDWEVALGDIRISRSELETLASLKLPLVRVRGQWVEMHEGEIQAAIDFWGKREPGHRGTPMSMREVIDLSLGLRNAPGELPVVGVEAEDEIAQLLGRLDGTVALQEQVPPAGFVGTLRPYQVRGYSWLIFLRELGMGACLADDMGLGKTIQALALMQRDREQGEQRPVLLVCPTSVMTNWQREAARFTPDLELIVHHGADRLSGASFARAVRSLAVVVTSYSLVQRDLASLKRVDWAGVVLDEAQNVKNPDTKQSKAVRALPAEYRLALTGTPVENHVGDLWSLMDFLIPSLLGTRAQFRDHFFLPIQTRRDRDATALLQRMTRPFVLRRLKTDRDIVKDLPEKIEQKVYCTLTEEQASLYQAVLEDAEDALSSSSGIQRRGVVLALISKLKQVCNHPAHFLGDRSSLANRSGKLVRLTEMLDEALSVGDRALVFTQFTEMGEILKSHLEEHFGREVLYLHGGVSKTKRDTMVLRFQEENGPSIFLLSLRAGGTGLNLTQANHVFHFDRWWNPAVENQATDRAFRIGQTRNVQVHKMICAGTLEDSVDALIERKRDVAEHVVGTGEGWLTELTSDELRDVLALRTETLGV